MCEDALDVLGDLSAGGAPSVGFGDDLAVSAGQVPVLIGDDVSQAVVEGFEFGLGPVVAGIAAAVGEPAGGEGRGTPTQCDARLRVVVQALRPTMSGWAPARVGSTRTAAVMVVSGPSAHSMSAGEMVSTVAAPASTSAATQASTLAARMRHES